MPLAMFRSQPGHRVLFLFLFIHLANNSLPDLKQPQQLMLSDEQCASLGLFFERKKGQIITKGHVTNHCFSPCWRPYGYSNCGVSSALWEDRASIKSTAKSIYYSRVLCTSGVTKMGQICLMTFPSLLKSVFTPRLPVLCSRHQTVTNPSATSTGAGTFQKFK